MIKKSTSWVVLIYGLLIFGAGYYGYSQTGSQISLISASAFGLLLLISSLLMFRSIRAGSKLAMITSALLALLFSIRYSLTGKEWLAIPALLSAILFLYLLFKTRKRRI